jgi:hypothetical protein
MDLRRIGVACIRAWSGLERKSKIGLIGLLLIAAGGAFLVGYATRFGPWAASDSVEYIVSARNLRAGRGLGLYTASGRFQPLSLHPPLYPLVLAALGFLDPSLIGAARWLNVGAVLIATLLLGLGLFRLTRSFVTSLGFGLTFVTLPATLLYSAGAMSEALSLVLACGSVVWLIVFLSKGGWMPLMGAGACAGLAALARLPWLALLPGGVIALILFDRGSGRSRWAKASAYSTLGLLPTIAWLAWLNYQGISAGPRQWVWPGGSPWYLLNEFRIGMVNTLWSWLPMSNLLPSLSYRVRLGSIGALALLGAAAGIVSLARLSRTRRTHWSSLAVSQGIVLTLAIALSYIGLLIVTWLFTMPKLTRADLDDRLMYPLQLLLILLGFLVLHLLGEASGRRRMATVAGLALAGALNWNALPSSWQNVMKLHQEGSGYTSPGWRDSEAIAWLRDFPSDVALISNETAALMFLLDRPSYNIPELTQQREVELYTRFGDGDTPEDRLFRECRATLVLFGSAFDQFVVLYDQHYVKRWETFRDGLALVGSAPFVEVFIYDNPDTTGVVCGHLSDRVPDRSAREGPS